MDFLNELDRLAKVAEESRRNGVCEDMKTKESIALEEFIKTLTPEQNEIALKREYERLGLLYKS